MPKHRKTKKQKLQASMRQQHVPSADFQPSATFSPTISDLPKTPEKFSLSSASIQMRTGADTHGYLRGELMKTGILSAVIILGELMLFFLLKNHMIVLSNIPY